MESRGHVALKFLAAHLLDDAEAKQRFLREAKADGSVDLYIGSEKPEGVPVGNWIHSVKGRSFFVYFRVYGVEDAYMNKTWLVPDFERIE